MMDEQQWLTCSDPYPMLEFLRERGIASERKLRLFAAACCRRIWPRMTDARSRYAVELAERSADEPVSEEELDVASGAAEEAYEDSLTDDKGEAVGDDDLRPVVAAAASYASSPGTMGAEHFSVILEGGTGASAAETVREKSAQAALIRCVFDNPFRPKPAVEPVWLAWNGGIVATLANQAYDERQMPTGTLDADRLAVLADALEEAGCHNAELLGHLRSDGTHARGCWAVDLLRKGPA